MRRGFAWPAGVAVRNRPQWPDSVQRSAASVDRTDEPVCPRSIGESVDNYRHRWTRNCHGAPEPGSSQCFPKFCALETGRGLAFTFAGGLGRQVEFRY
jgi:hypothetical protein